MMLPALNWLPLKAIVVNGETTAITLKIAVKKVVIVLFLIELSLI